MALSNLVEIRIEPSLPSKPIYIWDGSVGNLMDALIVHFANLRRDVDINFNIISREYTLAVSYINDKNVISIMDGNWNILKTADQREGNDEDFNHIITLFYYLCNINPN